MVYYDENETSAELIAVTLGAVFLVPYVAMLCLGALASHHNMPQIALGYFDVWLINLILAMVRGRKSSKWYRKVK